MHFLFCFVFLSGESWAVLHVAHTFLKVGSRCPHFVLGFFPPLYVFPLWCHCTAASIQKKSIKWCELGWFHFRHCCDLLHTARQLAVNKDFHNLVWPFPIRGTTAPWRILQRAEEQLFGAPLPYHQSADLECACVVVMRSQLVLGLLRTEGCVCKPW